MILDLLHKIVGGAPMPSEPRERVEPRIVAQTDFVDVPSSDKVRMGQIFGDIPTASGAVVNERTAMRVSAAYACTRLIAGAIASLPVHVYERKGSERERIEHEYWWLLNEQPTPTFSAASFWEYATGQVLNRGDGLAFIVRDRNGTARGFVPLRRSEVVIERKDGRLRYYFRDDAGKAFGADQDDILHFPGFGFDGTCSMSVISWAARQAIGIALRADEFAAQFYGNGAHPHHVITAPAQMTQEQQDALREAWAKKYSGAGITGIPLVLTEGLAVKEMSITPKDSEFLESRKFQVVDIARAYGVPPFLIGETEKTSSWGSGVEQMGIGFVIYTLMPHLNRFKQELNRKLFKTSRYFVEFLPEGLLRGDAKSRAEYYKAALGGTQAPAWMKPNEVRAIENLPRLPEGDQLFAPTKSAKRTSAGG